MIIDLIKFHTFRFKSRILCFTCVSLSLSCSRYSNKTTIQRNLGFSMSVDSDRNERSGFIASKTLPLSFSALPCRNMTKFFMKMKLPWVLFKFFCDYYEISVYVRWNLIRLWWVYVMPCLFEYFIFANFGVIS